MTRNLMAAAVAALVCLAAGETTEASGLYPGYGYSSRQTSPQYYVVPRCTAGYSQPNAYYESSYDNNPAVRLRYGYGGYMGNYYRDPQGGFQVRSDSRYWFGIHR